MVKFLANTKIRTKFLIIPVLVSLALAVFFVVLFQSLNSQYASILNFSKQDLEYSQELVSFFNETNLYHNRLHQFYSKVQKSESKRRYTQARQGLVEGAKSLQIQINHLANDYQHSKEAQYQIDIVLKIYTSYHKLCLQLIDFVGTQPKMAFNQVIEITKEFSRFRIFTKELQSQISKSTQNSILAYQQKATQNFNIVVLIYGVFMVGIMALSLFLAKYLSRPISRLIRTINDITKTADYHIRVTKESGGEFGQLTDGLNQMLFEIERATSSFAGTKDFLNNVTNSITHFLIVTNNKGLIKKVNPSTLQALGYHKNEIIDEPLGRVVTKDNKELNYQDLLENPNHTPVQMQLKNKSGVAIDVNMATFPMKDKHGVVVGSICLSYL